MHRAGIALAALAALAGGCDGCCGGSSYDPFPIAVDLSSGPVMLAAADGSDGASMPALVDTMSPVTVVDDGADDAAQFRCVDCRLLASTGLQPRAQFGLDVLASHPCASAGACQVGVDAAVRDVRVIVGADLLSKVAVRFDFPAAQLRLFPDIAGDDSARALACDAVFPDTLAGGGTLELGDQEVDFGAHKVAIGACLAYDAESPAPAVRGLDALFVIGTGLPISLLSVSAWERYRAVIGDDAVAPPLASLPATTVTMASGPIAAHLGSIDRMALMGEGVGEADKRGPCTELYAHHIMAAAVCVEGADDACSQCGDNVPANGPCPCPDKGAFCPVSAGIELDRSFPVAIIDDLDLDGPLQALREELRPDLPDVDGVLAPGALAPLQMDVDYPDGRVVARCGDPSGCLTRPQIGNKSSVAALQECPGL
ncbi:MAG TPA: hypothetical protein VL172_02030 [Kofleriaceae bacterium]|nr:hypothetical protein [Kofleriaceae bacterium]